MDIIEIFRSFSTKTYVTGKKSAIDCMLIPVIDQVNRDIQRLNFASFINNCELMHPKDVCNVISSNLMLSTFYNLSDLVQCLNGDDSG
ncbi:hypothetical protein D5018_12105 [Parashewanella curva]|uniref:Uncharacterized protein n=1 Tax=Parashewanella curva TaxID=2338552 RepID=A0A3L8PYA3_9GAMM|nr:hypothetical protein [Parashewanella curva]RLV59438.1 hypothetical protein D5018_12105 [Parashewanella curva]